MDILVYGKVCIKLTLFHRMFCMHCIIKVDSSLTELELIAFAHIETSFYFQFLFFIGFQNC